MRIGVLLAKKGYEEGGCPIGGVIINNETRKIVGKGHNTLVQENHPYNHGETSAARDAGRLDFSETTMFTTLSPCDICAALIYRRQFQRWSSATLPIFPAMKKCFVKRACRWIFWKIPTASLYLRNT